VRSTGAAGEHQQRRHHRGGRGAALIGTISGDIILRKVKSSVEVNVNGSVDASDIEGDITGG
jgi:hypothetical protein